MGDEGEPQTVVTRLGPHQRRRRPRHGWPPLVDAIRIRWRSILLAIWPAPGFASPASGNGPLQHAQHLIYLGHPANGTQLLRDPGLGSARNWRTNWRIQWRPDGDSNPGYRRERAVS